MTVTATFVINCSNAVEPADSNYSDQIPRQHTSLSFSINYSDLSLDGLEQLYITENYIPDSSMNIRVKNEFLLTPGDSFTVKIKNCSSATNWFVDVGDSSYSMRGNWINNEVELIKRDSVLSSDNTVDYKYYFRSIKRSKGYICFAELNDAGSPSMQNLRGLIIGYTAGALDSVWVKLNSVEWICATNPYSRISVRLKGTTNAYRIRGVGHGDGVNSAVEIPVKPDNSFDIKYSVAFLHAEGVVLKTDTELLLYGSAGLPKKIKIANPYNEGSQ